MESLIDTLDEASLRRLLKSISTSSAEGAALVEAEMGKMGKVAAAGAKNGGQKKEYKKKEYKQKPFDMSRYHQRHVAMQIQYDGGPYHGFAAQAEEDDETVEKHIFNTLLKLRLITGKKECNYSRCGRTDKGVSALGQVIGVKVRSNLPIEADGKSKRNLHPCDSVIKLPKKEEDDTSMEQDEGEQKNKKKKKGKKSGSGKSSVSTDEVFEVDYCGLMNKNLPESIRVLSWCETSPDFSARFSASYRMYRYFFTAKNLDIAAMQKGATFMVGEHDFRNFCKMNVAEVSNFRRQIYYASILLFHEDTRDPRRTVYMLEIKGVAFLWHMVRCIMSVLLLIGEGREQPEVVLDMLDVESNPGKPTYGIADETPLVLHECGFENLRLLWQPSVLWSLTQHFETLYDRHMVAAARALNSIQYLRERLVRKKDITPTAAPSPKEDEEDEKEEPPSKRAKADGSEASMALLTWGDVLDSLTDTPYPFPSVVVVPSSKAKDVSIATSPFSGRGATGTGGGPPYVPLMHRNKCDVYEDKIKHISGLKKYRFDKHMEIKSKASDKDTAAFFQNCRREGSLEEQEEEEEEAR